MRTIWIVDEGTLSVSEAEEVYRKGAMTVFRRIGVEGDTYTRNCRPTRKDAVAFAIQMAREEIVKGQEAQRALTLLMADVDAPDPDEVPESAGSVVCEFRKMPETPSLVGNAYLHAFTPPEMSVDVLEVGPNGPRVARLQEGAPPIYDVPHGGPCPKSHHADPEAVSYDPEPEEDGSTDEYEANSGALRATISAPGGRP